MQTGVEGASFTRSTFGHSRLTSLASFRHMRYFIALVSVPNADGRRMRNQQSPLFTELDREMWVKVQGGEGSALSRDEDMTVRLGVAIVDPHSPLTPRDAVDAAMQSLNVKRYKLKLTQPATLATALFNAEPLPLARHEMAGVAHALDISEVVALLRYPDFFHDELASEMDLDTANALAANTKYGDKLAEELHRIHESDRNEDARVSGVPVHYLIRSDGPVPSTDALHALTSTLYSSGRVATPHIYHFDLNYSDRALDGRALLGDRAELIADSMNTALTQKLRGGTAVVHYGQHDNGADFNAHQYEAVTSLLRALYQEPAIQVILVIPDGKPHVEKRLRSAFPRAFVAFEPSSAPSMVHDPDATKRWLEEHARVSGLEPDEQLAKLVDDHRENPSANDPVALFERWRQDKLLRESYPQYSGLPLAPLQTDAAATTAWERLDSLIGLDNVKKVIRETIDQHRMRPHYLAAGIELPPASLHAAFLGAPGTGKTEIARLYAEILREEGVVKEGRIFEVSGAQVSDFAKLFNRAKGSVIFIDEAYALIGRSSIAELIAQMENNRADTVVILAGYKDEMEALFRTNPGFKSRIGVTVNFPDYSSEEMAEIFQLMVRDAGLLFDDDTLSAARDDFSRSGRPEDQGNARHVRDLFEQVQKNLLLRVQRTYPDPSQCTADQLRTVLPEDIPGYRTASEVSGPSAREELETLIGLHTVKEQVKKIVAVAAAQKARRDKGIQNLPIAMHMAFKGNPGTGKTEVARLMARILREEGVLSVGDLIECGRQDLVGQFVGHTAPKVHNLFRRARGSVLFIDEAYTLVDKGNGGYGQEAIDTIVKDMEDYRDEVVVIFAGYPKPIEKLFATNPGFESRVKYHIDFPDYSTNELIQVLDFMAATYQLELEPDVYPKVETIIDAARGTDGFGNARFVRKLLESALEHQALRFVGQGATGVEHQQLTFVDFSTPIPHLHPKPNFGFHSGR